MTDDKLHTTRRKVLASLGAVGAGAAASGLGTTAWLNDTESFDGNTTTAGTLDLKVDWQQHYYGPTEEWEYVNAHPDHDGDGKQSVLHPTGEYAVEYAGTNIVDFLTCDTPGFDDDYDYGDQDSLVELSDVKPGDEGEITFSLHLCGNPGYVWMQGAEADNSENGYAEPEPDTGAGGDALDPGDPDGRGELAENVEVEMWYDDDCDNEVDDGEVADIVFTLDASGSMFYDRYGGLVSDDPITVDGEERAETTKIDLVERGVRQFLQGLADAGPDVDVRAGVLFFDGFDPDDGTLDHPQTELYGLADPSDLDASLGNFREILAGLTGGSTNPSDGGAISTGTALEPGIERAQAELAAGRPGVQAVNIVFTDGEPWRGGSLQSSYFDGVSDAAADAREDDPTPATDVYVIGDQTSNANAQDLVLDVAGPANSSGGDESHLFELSDATSIPRLFQQVAQIFLPDEVFYSGTLADALAELEDGRGIPLDANRFTAFDELSDDDGSDGRDYYVPGVTRCVGFRWCLPPDVGNEIQGDSVAFDLGFYGEQARHAGGAGADRR